LLRRPRLLTFCLWWALVTGSLSILFLALAPFDLGSYSINETAVSGPEFLRRIGILWTAMSLSCLAIAYALWKDLEWSREAIMFFWLVTTVTLVVSAKQDGQSVIGSLFTGGFCATLAAWYLYGRDRVSAYYRGLRASASPSPDGV
jgi:hypothetical protein